MHMHVIESGVCTVMSSLHWESVRFCPDQIFWNTDMIMVIISLVVMITQMSKAVVSLRELHLCDGVSREDILQMNCYPSLNQLLRACDEAAEFYGNA